VKLKAISQAVTSRAGRQLLVVKKHSPVLLFAAGVVGVVGTVVLASRATLKLDSVLDKTKEGLDAIREKQENPDYPDFEYSDQDRTKDLVRVYTQTAAEIVVLYGPAAILGVVSVAALTGSHVILSRRNVALTAAYAAIDKGFREYRSRVVHELGENKDREFRYGLQERTIVEETDEGPVTLKVKDVLPADVSVYAKFFEKGNKNWSPQVSYNSMFIKCQQNYANDLLMARGHVFLNEVYDMLGIPRTREGAIVGWVKGNGDNFIDFGVFDGDWYSGMRFVNGHESSVLLDFNVDGVIYNLI
jgi:hypothetical protein